MVLCYNKSMKNEKNKAIFWDYDIDKMDLRNPRVKVWYLNRKIQFGDLRGISRRDLRKYLPKLQIDPSMRELLSNFLQSNQ